MEWGLSFGKASNKYHLFPPLINILKFDPDCPCKFPKVNGLCEAVMYHSINYLRLHTSLTCVPGDSVAAGDLANS